MRAFAFVVISGFLGACGPAPTRGEALLESVTTYNDGVRWDRLAIAASRVPPAERDEFVDERDELAEDLEITDWEVKRVRQEGAARARVHVKYTWYRSDEGVVHETHADQRWERRGKAWLILEEHRLRGEPMPGLAEPPTEDADAEPRAEVR